MITNFLLLLFYILGVILTYIYLIETVEINNKDYKIILFCCALVFPIFTMQLFVTRIDYFSLDCIKIEETPEPIKESVPITFGF